MADNTDPNPPTARPPLDLGAIELRAAYLYEYMPLPAKAKQLTNQVAGEDVPALVAELKQVRAEVADLQEDVDSEEVVIRQKRFILPTPWPKGAAIGELRKMLARIDAELGENVRWDTAAWVQSEDDQVVIYIETKENAQ